MKNQIIDFKKMNDTELKALCFDFLCQIEETQSNLNIVRNELKSRLSQQPVQPTQENNDQLGQ